MKENKNIFSKIIAGVKEFFRKKIVDLKRNPKIIPLVLMAVAFFYYSLNLTNMSDTTAVIQKNSMGLCQFCIMLFSMLAIVCMLNAFPRRQKPNYLMVGVMFVMFAVLILCSVNYINTIDMATSGPTATIPITDYMIAARTMLVGYAIMVGITAALVALMPVYTKLLRKINTSVAIEYSDNMAEIEISE